MSSSQPATVHRSSDLCDRHGDAAQVCRSAFTSFGGRGAASGSMVCVRVFEDAALVRTQLERPGEGRVLVVDAGGSLRVAVLGDRMARLGMDNGWNGVIVHGAVRDADHLAALDIAVFALGTSPARGGNSGMGESDAPLRFGEAVFAPGQFICADRDGVVVLTRAPTAD